MQFWNLFMTFTWNGFELTSIYRELSFRSIQFSACTFGLTSAYRICSFGSFIPTFAWVICKERGMRKSKFVCFRLSNSVPLCTDGVSETETAASVAKYSAMITRNPRVSLNAIANIIISTLSRQNYSVQLMIFRFNCTVYIYRYFY